MKKIPSLFIGFIIFFMLSGIATAYTINGASIDVGQLDGFISKTSLGNNGDSTELDWVNSILNPVTSFSYKIEQKDFGWQETDTQGIWANFLALSPDYFLIKTGGNKNTDYLFKNLDFKSYAVIDLSMFDAPGNSSGLTISGISHITAFGGPPTTHHSPEPATMLLLGFGLLGVAGACRRKK